MKAFSFVGTFEDDDGLETITCHIQSSDRPGCAAAIDWFEEGVLRLDKALSPNRLVCRVTCLYADYSPGGHGLMG